MGFRTWGVPQNHLQLFVGRPMVWGGQFFRKKPHFFSDVMMCMIIFMMEFYMFNDDSYDDPWSCIFFGSSLFVNKVDEQC